MRISRDSNNRLVYESGTYADLSPEDLLVRLDALKDDCILIGKQILHKSSESFNWELINFLAYRLVPNIAGLTVKDFGNLYNVEAWLRALPAAPTESEPFKDFLLDQRRVLSLNPADIYPLLAVKELIDSVAKTEVHTDGSVSNGRGFGAHASGTIGGETAGGSASGGIGGGATRHQNFEWSCKVSIALKAYLLPMAKWLDHIIRAQAPDELPSKDEVIECWLRGKMTAAETQGYLALNGCSWQLWQRVALSRAERPTIHDLIQDAKRRNLTYEKTIELLRKNGYAEGFDPTIWLRNYTEYPSITDHIHWISKV